MYCELILVRWILKLFFGIIGYFDIGCWIERRGRVFLIEGIVCVEYGGLKSVVSLGKL